MTTQWNKAGTKDSVLTENTAQSVFKYLNELVSSRTRVHTRWIWELLQNARDASKAVDNHLIADIKYSPKELVFLHNGSRFKVEEIAHLIFHGSTKVEEEDTIGQYGSGFLTTHLLSWAIDISGQLDNDQWFDFRLARKPDSVGALRDSMDQAWENFNPSLSPQVPMPKSFTTRFVYPIEDDAVDAVEKGIATLKQCAPFVVVFNPEFSRININIDIDDRCETMCFEVVERRSLDSSEIQQITVAESTNENCTKRKYLLAQGTKALVTVPLKSIGDSWECLPVENNPRLFLGFPLVGTEEFGFPAIINSLHFTPTENRDGVYLGEGDNDANIKNQEVIEEACDLLVRLLGDAAYSGWRNAHLLAEVPVIQNQNGLKREWLKKCIEEKLIEKIRQTPAVINKNGNAIAPKAAMVPLAENDKDVKALWDLLDDWQEDSEKLPRRDEATGWCDSIKSWAKVSESKASEFDEAIDGDQLASRIENWCFCLEDLQNLLQENVCAVKWLNQLYGFLRDNGFDDQIRNRCFVLDQAGDLDLLDNLHRDQGIDEELKNIAELLDLNIQSQLRDTRLTSLEKENGAGDKNSTEVVDSLIKKLKEYAEKNLNDNFKKASVRLFAWIIGQKDYSRLRGFPVFAEDDKSDSLSVFYLPSAAPNGQPPLAPVHAWPEGLQKFSDLFPPSRILADAFFEGAPAPETWRMLDEQDLIRRDMIITRNDKVNLKAFSPEVDRDEGVHNTVEPVIVTDVVERVGIMDRVSDSQHRAHLFWQFLTEWLVKEDGQGLESAEVACECGEGVTHKYYPAEWLMPVRNNSWIRREGSLRVRATAESLASLLRDSGWEPDSLNENPATVELLKAIDVRKFDLMREIASENDEQRNAQDDILTEILVAAKGKLDPLLELAQDMKEDDDLLTDLKERRERRRTVHENQRLGQQVEEWVKENLEQEGFTVRRTGIGSDFEISNETGDLITLGIDQCGKSWLIEVKFTRGNSVQMTFKQAETAVEKGNEFLLCIVPIGPENIEPDLEIVRANMLFIKNIGSRVSRLYEDLDAFEDLRVDITADVVSGVKLVYETGTTGIRVYHSVWEDDGVPLEKLAKYLQ